MGYTNAQKLAAVVNAWAQPAITQLATSKLAKMPFLQSLKQMAVGYGLVGDGYNISSDIEPMIKPVVSSLLRPWLESQFSKLPDNAIPMMSRNVVQQMLDSEDYSILDGYVSFDRDDLEELKDLIEKNLPLKDEEQYELIK